MSNKSDKTNNEKVVEFAQQFGVKGYDYPNTKVFTEDPDLVEFRMNLIREEMKELEDAVKDNDYTEMVDALSDILYVVYGMGISMGVDLDKAFAIVHDSNMSKLCKTEEEAQKTVAWYKEQYVQGKQPYDTPEYRKSDCGGYWVVYNKSTSKILKSINWKLVDFSSLIPK